MIEKKFQVLKRQRPWRDAFFYQKSEVIYQMTYVFCERFLPKHGDRTVDQMIQAARSGKQNIIEGTEDGETSTEMHIKLINVARSSLQELREDYKDFLLSRGLEVWNASHPRFKSLTEFCRTHNRLEEYQPFFAKWNAEEMCNTALTLCYMTDAMLNKHLKSLESDFIENGGIKERMHAARTGYRKSQDQELISLREKIPVLNKRIAYLESLLKKNNIPF